MSHAQGIPYPQNNRKFEYRRSCMTVIEFRTHNGLWIPRVTTMLNDEHLYHELLQVNGRLIF